MNAAPLLSLTAVSKTFVRSSDAAERLVRLFSRRQPPELVRAVDTVDLAIRQGEVIGLVGESGCGKSTLARIVAGIHEPSSGSVDFRGRSRQALSGAERRAADLAVQMVFQDAMASLNPRLRVVDIVGEAPHVHGLVAKKDVDAYVAELLTRVGLDPAVRGRFPHQFSGGQRARIGIARALAVNPALLVCDEATAALDVSIQAQVLNLFISLRAASALTFLFVSHDLGVIRHLADRVAVMYLGRIVEIGPTEELFAAPGHPYTRALLSEIPRLEPRKKRFAALDGDLPSPLAPPPGCHFHPRCPFAMDRCRKERPILREVGPGRSSACHLDDKSAVL